MDKTIAVQLLDKGFIDEKHIKELAVEEKRVSKAAKKAMKKLAHKMEIERQRELRTTNQR